MYKKCPCGSMRFRYDIKTKIATCLDCDTEFNLMSDLPIMNDGEYEAKKDDDEKNLN